MINFEKLWNDAPVMINAEFRKGGKTQTQSLIGISYEDATQQLRKEHGEIEIVRMSCDEWK